MFSDQDSEFGDDKLTNLDSVSVDRNPSLDNELANKKYNHDSIGEGTKVRFNQSLQKLLVGYDVYRLTKYDKIRTTDTTFIKYPNVYKHRW